MLAEVSIFPVGEGVSLSKWVGRCLRIIDGSGLRYQLNPMGTVIEGDYDEVMEVIRRCHMAVLEDTERVSTYIKIDDRKGTKEAMLKKVQSVEERAGRPLSR
ncbi:MAG: MTH1187 family thiamine-binding protein [Thermoplasmata archaeon]|nr:MTH1187 family thiamine-binding protein [Thermoplasmata archaeon]